jgi:hypothetical protein
MQRIEVMTLCIMLSTELHPQPKLGIVFLVVCGFFLFLFLVNWLVGGFFVVVGVFF